MCIYFITDMYFLWKYDMENYTAKYQKALKHDCNHYENIWHWKLYWKVQPLWNFNETTLFTNENHTAIFC